MITSFNIENLGPISSLKTDTAGKLNLVIGPNSSGKTFLLKALYTLIRSHEEFETGNDRREFAEVLSDKLYWVFQSGKIGDLVQKGEGKKLKVACKFNDAEIFFQFGHDTVKRILNVENDAPIKQIESVFIPPKEILSISNLILKTNLQDKLFGFDATYSDLVLALQKPAIEHRKQMYRDVSQQINTLFKGSIYFDDQKKQYVYKVGHSTYTIHSTAEGIKKISVFQRLIENEYLKPGSVVFIDEPEASLHPQAISVLIDFIVALANAGIQVFIASHSYFVVKKLYLCAVTEKINIPVFKVDSELNWSEHRLNDGIPENEIINESVRLFEEELSNLT